MAIFKQLSDNVIEVGVMVIAVVLISILLGNFKTSAFVCPGTTNTTHTTYNGTFDICCHPTLTCAGPSGNSTINNIGTGINTSITGVGTPISYITIIILVIVFAAILVMLIQKLRNRT